MLLDTVHGKWYNSGVVHDGADRFIKEDPRPSLVLPLTDIGIKGKVSGRHMDDFTALHDTTGRTSAPDPASSTFVQ